MISENGTAREIDGKIVRIINELTRLSELAQQYDMGAYSTGVRDAMNIVIRIAEGQEGGGDR